MRVRAVHFACVMVLLSTLGAAEAYASPGADYGARAQRIGILLQQGVAALAQKPLARTRDAWSEQAQDRVHARSTPIDLPMRPPAEHSVRLHAVTGSGL